MNRSIYWLTCSLGLIFGLDLSSRSALAQEEEVQLRIVNTLDRTVNFYVASETRKDENRWVGIQVQPDVETVIHLRSPDKFELRVQTAEQNYYSQPLELKAFLKAHPSYVLDLKDLVPDWSKASVGGREGETQKGWRADQMTVNASIRPRGGSQEKTDSLRIVLSPR